MPNWVQNNVCIDCDAETINRIYQTVQYDPNTESDEMTGHGSIDFNKIVPMPECLAIESGSNTDKGIEIYLTVVNPQTRDFGKPKMEPEAFGTLCAALNAEKLFRTYNCNLSDKEIENSNDVIGLGEQAVSNLLHYGATTWYDWCIKNWGTKWNSCYAEEMENGLSFQTAWSSPVPIIARLSSMFPEAKFTLEYADEDIGVNCGRLVFQGGFLNEEYYPELGEEAIRFACSVWDYDPEDFIEVEE